MSVFSDSPLMWNDLISSHIKKLESLIKRDDFNGSSELDILRNYWRNCICSSHCIARLKCVEFMQGFESGFAQSLSHSLYLIHTRTHTHTHTQNLFLSLSLSLSLPLWKETWVTMVLARVKKSWVRFISRKASWFHCYSRIKASRDMGTKLMW